MISATAESHLLWLLREVPQLWDCEAIQLSDAKIGIINGMDQI
jgi:hypothetical protein